MVAVVFVVVVGVETVFLLLMSCVRVTRSPQLYFASGILQLQHVVDSWILSVEGGADGEAAAPTIRLADFPSPEYEDSGFWAQVRDDCCSSTIGCTRQASKLAAFDGIFADYFFLR